jgi:hypothetical protein
MTRDEDHLRLLSIFHYVYAGITALSACVPVFHLAFGIAIVSGAFPSPPGQPMPRAFGWFFVVAAGGLMLFGWACAVCVFLAARRLERRTGYWFCFVIACVNCAFVPLGTALGVCTLIVLSRPAVKALFGVSPGDEGWRPPAFPAADDAGEAPRWPDERYTAPS